MSEAFREDNVSRLGEPAHEPTLVQWARFRDQFAATLGEGFWTLDDLEARIAAHTSFFFPGKELALVGQIELYPGGNQAFRVTQAVGPMDERVAMLPGVEALARMLGCTVVLIEAQTGLQSEVPGYEPYSVTVGKVL